MGNANEETTRPGGRSPDLIETKAVPGISVVVLENPGTALVFPSAALVPTNRPEAAAAGGSDAESARIDKIDKIL